VPAEPVRPSPWYPSVGTRQPLSFQDKIVIESDSSSNQPPGTFEDTTW
jgi:hypothetical protein